MPPLTLRDLRRTPRAVWFALATGVIVSIGIVSFVYVPILGLIAASGAAAWFVRVPVASITLVSVLGFAFALALLAPILRWRHGPIAWILAVAAVICTVVVSVYPAVAVATVAVHSAADVIPWIAQWVDRARSLLPGSS